MDIDLKAMSIPDLNDLIDKIQDNIDGRLHEKNRNMLPEVKEILKETGWAFYSCFVFVFKYYVPTQLITGGAKPCRY